MSLRTLLTPRHAPLLWIPLSFAAGLLAAHAGAIEIDTKLSIGVIVSACVTLAIAVSIQVLFQRNMSEARIQRDLLTAHTRELKASVKECRDLMRKAYHDGVSVDSDAEILAALRVASNQMSTLEAACGDCDVEAGGEALATARLALRSYRKLLTDRSFNLNVPYADDTYQGAEVEYGRLERALLIFMLRINRS